MGIALRQEACSESYAPMMRRSGVDRLRSMAVTGIKPIAPRPVGRRSSDCSLARRANFEVPHLSPQRISSFVVPPLGGDAAKKAA